MSVQAEPTFSMYVQLCSVTVWILVSVSCLYRRISLHCTTKSSCFRSRLCMIHSPLSTMFRICIFFQPEFFDLAVSQSLPSCFVHNGYVDWTRPWVLHLPDCSLARLQTGNCIMLCWTSYFARTATPVKIWWSGFKQVLRANDICVRLLLLLIAFSLDFLSFLFLSVLMLELWLMIMALTCRKQRD